MKRADIIARLSAFPYDAAGYWLVTGGAMVLYGIREETSDIDLGCTKELADRLEAEGYLHALTSDGRRWFKVGDDIELFEGWLCDTTVLVDGVPTVSIRGLIAMKQALGREKDVRDIELIRRFLETAPAEKCHRGAR